MFSCLNLTLAHVGNVNMFKLHCGSDFRKCIYIYSNASEEYTHSYHCPNGYDKRLRAINSNLKKPTYRGILSLFEFIAPAFCEHAALLGTSYEAIWLIARLIPVDFLEGGGRMSCYRKGKSSWIDAGDKPLPSEVSGCTSKFPPSHSPLRPPRECRYQNPVWPFCYDPQLRGWLRWCRAACSVYHYSASPVKRILPLENKALMTILRLEFGSCPSYQQASSTPGWNTLANPERSYDSATLYIFEKIRKPSLIRSGRTQSHNHNIASGCQYFTLPKLGGMSHDCVRPGNHFQPKTQFAHKGSLTDIEGYTGLLSPQFHVHSII